MRSASLYTSLSTEVDGLSVFFSQFLGKLGGEVSKRYPDYEPDHVISFLLGLLFVMCMPVFVLCFFVCVCALVCVCVSCVGLCAPWLMHDMLPRVVEFGLIARLFLLVPPFDFFCLSAIFCNTVKYNVLAPF